MAVRIRLTRVGATKRPAYRVIAIDKRRSRDGRALEILGFYDPLTEPATVHLETARINDWIGRGAQPSETVAKLIRQAEKAAQEPTTEKPKRATRASKPKLSAKAKAKAAAGAAGGETAAAPEAEAVTTDAPETVTSDEAEAVTADEATPDAEPAAADATPEAEATDEASEPDGDKAEA